MNETVGNGRLDGIVAIVTGSGDGIGARARVAMRTTGRPRRGGLLHR